MLAPTFDILEDTDVFSGPTGGSSKTKSAGKKGLGLRASAGPNNSNIKAFGGPQKSGLQQLPKSSRKAPARKKSFGAGLSSSSKSRAFGSVLATPNSNNASAHPQQSGKKLSVTFSKAGPTPIRAKSARQKTVTSIEVCHKGPGLYKIADAETQELMRTNETAELVYKNARLGTVLGSHARAPRSSFKAPIDDDAAFGIFEDEFAEEEDFGFKINDMATSEAADLW
eukprot:INCI10224.2.p1 GENE.INCI10224.2~~INCI10224.2.p1  ORF type:complete len:226 (-),score=46.66 INCI10224.2:161-838(-)